MAGLTRLSSCDWPGRLVATVFLQGCPWSCTYCHNPDLQPFAGEGPVSWSDVRALLDRRHGLLDGVVFSGGEPTRQSALALAAREVRDMGFVVGLHTAGAYPRRLLEALPWVDWIGLDIKGLPDEYRAVTQVAAAGAKAYESLRIVVEAGVDHEVRITVDPSIHTHRGLLDLVGRLNEAGARRIVLQEMRVVGEAPRPPMPVLLDPPVGVVVRRAA